MIYSKGQASKEQQKSDQEIVAENGLHIRKGLIIDKSGKKYSKTLYAMTMFGPSEVKQAIIFDGRLIPLGEIPRK